MAAAWTLGVPWTHWGSAALRCMVHAARTADWCQGGILFGTVPCLTYRTTSRTGTKLSAAVSVMTGLRSL